MLSIDAKYANTAWIITPGKTFTLQRVLRRIFRKGIGWPLKRGEADFQIGIMRAVDERLRGKAECAWAPTRSNENDDYSGVPKE